MQLRRSLLLPAFMLPLLIPNPVAAEGACPVTTPPSPPFVPPAPYRPLAPGGTGAFWYGTSALWAQLPVDGVWRGLPRRDNGGYYNKLFLWQQGFDGMKEQQPDIVLVLKRLDATMPPVRSRGGTNAFFDRSWAMLTGILFPTDGCWEITSTHAGHTLTFVLSIQP